MSKTVIKVENVSKQYRLGEITTGSLTHDLNRWWHTVIGKEDPYLKIGEENDRTKKGGSEYVWALQNISFDVKQGEVLGIIGRNGAGKSTLLKLLSRTTLPTTGSIKAKGRIASLLEVGTGFHPDLSGRENIFLNGAILGMTRQEIKNKFDEIVDFAGVEKYIDTPVKRYSSGMYVRLAFAVAAHLEPEILIVDEVLAVGDAEFQKKCLGKMKDVSVKEGRTVLFVSHTMSAIKQLCDRSILLNRGGIEADGETIKVINQYMANNSQTESGVAVINFSTQKEINFNSISIFNSRLEVTENIDIDENFFVELDFEVRDLVNNVELSICFKNSLGIAVLFTSLSDVAKGEMKSFNPGKYKARAKIRSNFLLPDTYYLDIYAHHRNIDNIDSFQAVVKFTIIETGSYMAPYGSASSNFSCVLDKCEWKLQTLN